MDVNLIFSGATGGGIVAIIMMFFIIMVKRNLQKLDELTEQRIAKIEQHISNDKSQTILTKLEVIACNMERSDMRIERLLETSAAHAAKIEANALYISNIDKSIERRK